MSTRNQTRSIAVGRRPIVVEVAATLWILGQAMAIGVFHESDYGKLTAAGYLNEMLPRGCKRVRFTNERNVLDLTERISVHLNNATPVSYTQCDTLEDPPTAVGMRFCDCWSWSTIYAGDACRWTAAIASDEERGGLCLAKPIQAVLLRARTGWPGMMANVSRFTRQVRGKLRGCC